MKPFCYRCPEEARSRCGDCGKPICIWHLAGSPRMKGRTVVLIETCFPICKPEAA